MTPAVDCELSEWGDWEPCSSKCGGGSQNRTRNISIAAHGRHSCELTVESQPCNTDQCPGNEKTVRCQDTWGKYGFGCKKMVEKDGPEKFKKICRGQFNGIFQAVKSDFVKKHCPYSCGLCGL